jgi:AraC-like DNA-binding protein
MDSVNHSSSKSFLSHLRILESLRRLGREEQVSTVALDLGYNSPSAFIAMFKKALGKTPGQYFKEADS